MMIDTAVRRELLNDVTIAGYVQSKVFRWRLEEQIEGTGGRAIVVSRPGPGWAARDPVKTPEYPIVWIDLHADHDRDGGQIVTLNAIDKAYAMLPAVDDLFHNLRAVWIGAVGSNPGVRVITSMRPGEPRVITQSDLHGGDEQLGDTVKVRTEWNFQIA